MHTIPGTEALKTLAEHLAALPIQAHVACDQAIIEHCDSYLNKVLHFWHDNRSNVAIIEAFTTLLSHDYHHVMKAGSRELRHLMTINEANVRELEKLSERMETDSSIDQINHDQLAGLNQEGHSIENELSQFIESAITGLNDSLKQLKKASVRVWDKPSLSRSVIPKDVCFFISHATADKATATAICAEMESIGISTWRDDKDIIGGDSIPTEIGKGLEKATHFGLLYSNTSKDRPWVKTEFENALMLRERTGKPKIIPLLLDGLMPPTMLGNIKGIPFNDFKEGMELLWRGIGVPAGSRVSLDMIYKLQQRAHKAIEHVNYCYQEKRNALVQIDESIFDDFEDIEHYALSFPIRADKTPPQRFERTMVSFPTQKPQDFSPACDGLFYTHRGGAIAGAHLLRTLDGIAQRLLTMLEDIEATPLPEWVANREELL